MSGTDASLHRLAEAHGIHLSYFDLNGQRHDASPDTLRALLRALGVAAGSAKEVAEALALKTAPGNHMPSEQIVLAGHPLTLPTPGPVEWALVDESDRVVAEGRDDEAITLAALDVGYFRMRTVTEGREDETLILSRPDRAPDLATKLGQETCWGMTGALYGLRSARNGGLGSYDDLGHAGEILGRAGAQFFGVNPLHGLGWAKSEIISPYSPSHRGVFNIDHLSVPGGLGPTPAESFIDYAAYRVRHRAALEAAFAGDPNKPGFLDWARSCAPEFRHYAQYEAISETQGPDFTKWSKTLQRPGRAAERAAGDRARFHLWLQWLADQQIAAAQTRAEEAGMGLGLYLDLAVGPRLDGAEVWMNAATIAKGVSVGAPPDHLSPHGQSWALAAHAPGPLARAQYLPFRRMLRTLMTHCGLLRIDHALGLYRSFWLPDDGSPGGYITQPLDALLAIITIEAHRAGCVVVGEDLGLVPDGFRRAMNDAGLYSYAVWQYEANHLGEVLPASELPAHSLACFGTHDTPTLSGFWHGTDIEWWHRVGWISNGAKAAKHAARSRQRASLRTAAGITASATIDAVRDRVHTNLARSPAALVSVQLDDVFAETEAQNLPGTIDEHPNWRRRLTVPIEDMADAPALKRIADIMNAERMVTAPRQDAEKEATA